MGRTYVIADLHGRFDLLTKAIEIIEDDAGEDGGVFIVLGDFIDRGPQSREIIERLMKGPNKSNWTWIVLQGNHEAIMIEVVINPRLLNWWLANGGDATLLSYGYKEDDYLVPFKIPDEQIEWIYNLPVYVQDERRIYVHAGVPYNRSIKEVSDHTLQWMLYRSREKFKDAEIYADKPHCSKKHIVHGHHQSEKHPLLKKHRTNLDSFAWYTGRLAIGVFDKNKDQPTKILWASVEK